jgi:hypothetical protein
VGEGKKRRRTTFFLSNTFLLFFFNGGPKIFFAEEKNQQGETCHIPFVYAHASKGGRVRASHRQEKKKGKEGPEDHRENQKLHNNFS